MTEFARRTAAREIDAREEVARQDLATAIAEIFTPRVCGDRRVIKTERTYGHVTVRIAGPELTATDLGVLLALYVLAARNVSDVAPCATRGGLMPLERRDENAADGLDSLAVHTTLGEVAAMIGRDPRDTRAKDMVHGSLQYLMMVVVSGGRENRWAANHLISAAKDEGGGIVVYLNFRATHAVMGAGQWAAVDMARFREASEIERVLMHRLAAHCTGGAPLPVSLDRLAKTCWTRPPKNGDDARKRRNRIRDALPYALPANVTATIDQKGLVTFRRGTRNTRAEAV